MNKRQLSIQNQALMAYALIVLVGAFVITSNTAGAIGVNSGLNELLRTYDQATSLYESWVLLQRMEIANLSYYETGDEQWIATFESSNIWLDRNIDNARDIDIDQAEGEMEAALDTFAVAKTVYHQNFQDMVFAPDNAVEDQLFAASEDQVAAVWDSLLIGDQVYDYISSYATEIDDTSQRLIIYPIISTIVIVLLAILMIFLLHRQLNQPLWVLAQAADDVATGQFDPTGVQRLMRRQDEIGTLAQNFLEMIETKKARQAELEQEIEMIRNKIRS